MTSDERIRPIDERTADRSRSPAGIGRLSVIIANYNYERFLRAAIESALGLDWPDVEVVVVDDGSTDGSRAVIEDFRGRVRILHQDNSTERVARNAGFALSTGDAIIHLDSDDVLHPDLVRRVNAVWRQGVSKVQVQMRVVDASGRPTGARFPDFRRTPSPEQLRSWVERTSAHPTPPSSGNVYARRFLEQIFPLDERCGSATDSACLVAAPLLGDVLTVPEPLVDYRIHRDNASDLLSRPLAFAHEVERGRARFLYGRSLVSDHPRPDERALFRSREMLQLRIAANRLTPGSHPIPGDGRGRQIANILTSAFQPGPEPAAKRLAIAAWCLATSLSPLPIARRLVHRRYRRM